MQIVELPKERYTDFELTFDYDTAAYYALELAQTPTRFEAAFQRKDMPRVHKHFVSMLFQSHWDDPRCFGLLNNENTLCAVLEVTREEWSNRLRITNLSVFEGYRRRGYGSLLMCKAKAVARALGCRAMILETHSCNVGAIRFYLEQGFSFMGFDACAYTNEDDARHEVRLEMGLLISSKGAAG